MDTSKKIWNDILNSIGNKVIEIKTAPKTNRKPIWFSVRRDEDYVYVDKAIINEPSCMITYERKLEYKDFERVYPFFIRRENGERISAEVTQITRNQVYYFALIANLKKK